MKNVTTVVEISNSFIKVVIGSVQNKKLLVHYVNKTPIRNLVENGTIIDKEGLIEALGKVNPIDDDRFDIHQLIDDAVVIYPPYGLEIYSTSQITSVISRERIVENQDIINLYSIVSNKKLPINNDLIDIIPETFKLDSGEIYDVPPIGKSSRDITVKVDVHTVPKKLNSEFASTISRGGINISHKVASSFASNCLLSTMNLPKNYFLVDVGSNSTSISLIGNHRLLATRSFSWGGNSITERIMECFNINEKEAERLKCLYGIDKRKMNFLYPLAKSADGKEKYREDLNQIITECLDRFVNLCQVPIEQLASKYGVENYNSFPIVFIGGGSKLKGMSEYLKPKFNNVDIKLVTPEIIGARDSSLCACLGAILFHNRHKGVVEDINTAVTPVSRED